MTLCFSNCNFESGFFFMFAQVGLQVLACSFRLKANISLAANACTPAPTHFRKPL